MNKRQVIAYRKVLKVLLDQTMALDLRARHVIDENVVDHILPEELEEKISLYKLLFSIDGE